MVGCGHFFFPEHGQGATVMWAGGDVCRGCEWKAVEGCGRLWKAAGWRQVGGRWTTGGRQGGRCGNVRKCVDGPKKKKKVLGPFLDDTKHCPRG
jgi:hypothetical protein